VIEVLNKADLLPEGQLSGMAVSALNGDGLEALLALVDGRLGAGEQESLHRIDAGDGARIAWLHRHAEVLETIMEDDVLTLRVRMSATARARFAKLVPMDEAGPISANDP
jgi:GTP-binding protein HflX